MSKFSVTIEIDTEATFSSVEETNILPDLRETLKNFNWCVSDMNCELLPEEVNTKLYMLHSVYDGDEDMLIPLTEEQIDITNQLLNTGIDGTVYEIVEFAEYEKAKRVYSDWNGFVKLFLLLGHNKQDVKDEISYPNRELYLKLFNQIEHNK